MFVSVSGLGALGISKRARRFVAAKIRKLIREEGFEPRRAVAAAFRMAREAGYKVPRPPRS